MRISVLRLRIERQFIVINRKRIRILIGGLRLSDLCRHHVFKWRGRKNKNVTAVMKFSREAEAGRRRRRLQFRPDRTIAMHLSASTS